MFEGCEWDHANRPGGCYKPTGMISRMFEGQLSKYSFSAWITGRSTVTEKVGRSRPMKASICEVRTTLHKVTLDEMSSQYNSMWIRSTTLLVRGNNRIRRAAAYKTPDTGLMIYFRCSAKKSVTVVEACQDQRPHQGVRARIRWWVTDGSTYVWSQSRAIFI